MRKLSNRIIYCSLYHMIDSLFCLLYVVSTTLIALRKTVNKQFKKKRREKGIFIHQIRMHIHQIGMSRTRQSKTVQYAQIFLNSKRTYTLRKTTSVKTGRGGRGVIFMFKNNQTIVSLKPHQLSCQPTF